MTSIFVTGTDTGVGKTFISVALIKLLQQQGLKVAGMKPIASGCEPTVEGLRNDDALRLSQQSNVDLPYDLINPYAFEPAIAPHIAAEQADIEIDLNIIQQNYQKIQQQVDAVVVEGAGGWLVPLNKSQTMADLAIQLELPIILVVGIRLGCINHALLTVKAIESTGLSLQGWIANHPEPSEQGAEIVKTLKQSIKAPCLGNVPALNTKEMAINYLEVV
ncbi:MAG: dethiobiotin synthase [Gammaproteobacteria bacterium]|nr:MAG: dethiobiotin synthase [Gammaproteobacteria bacterium]